MHSIDRQGSEVDNGTPKRLGPRLGDTIDAIRKLSNEDVTHFRATIDEIFLAEDPHDRLPRLFTLLNGEDDGGSVVSAWWVNSAAVKISLPDVVSPFRTPWALLSIDEHDRSLGSRVVPALETLLPGFAAASPLDGPSGPAPGIYFQPLSAFAVWSLREDGDAVEYLVRSDHGSDISLTFIVRRRETNGSLSLDPLTHLWGEILEEYRPMDCFRFDPRYWVDIDGDGDSDFIGQDAILVVTPHGPIQVNQPLETGLGTGSIGYRLHWCHV